jgi:hypothetical protein
MYAGVCTRLGILVCESQPLQGGYVVLLAIVSSQGSEHVGFGLASAWSTGGGPHWGGDFVPFRTHRVLLGVMVQAC